MILVISSAKNDYWALKYLGESGWDRDIHTVWSLNTRSPISYKEKDKCNRDLIGTPLTSDLKVHPESCDRHYITARVVFPEGTHSCLCSVHLTKVYLKLNAGKQDKIRQVVLNCQCLWRKKQVGWQAGGRKLFQNKED